MLNGAGKLTRPGHPGYIPPTERPYPPQKVFLFPDEFLNQFKASFRGSLDG
jgi:hypothetical protein